MSGRMTRAAASVPANIAEGHGRGTRKDHANFVAIARGSIAELETFLMLVADVELAPGDRRAKALVGAEEVGRMLSALRAKLALPKT